MSDEVTRLAARVDAVERALSDGETGLDGIEDAAALDARLSELESTADALEARVAELEAAVEAVRGFAGGIRAANRAVERRAELALSKVEALETDRRDSDAPAWPPAATPGAGDAGGTDGNGGAGNMEGTGDTPSPPARTTTGRTADANAARRTDGGVETDAREERASGSGERPPDGSGLADRLRERL